MKKKICDDFAEYLLAEPTTTRLPDYKGWTQVYLIRDGRILEIQLMSTHAYNSRGVLVQVRQSPLICASWLYSSKEVYEARLDAERSPLISFKYSLPQQEAFLDRIDELSDQLPELLNVSRERLDVTIESFVALEQGILNTGSHRCIEPDIFPSIIAYVCKVLSLNLGATTEMINFFDIGLPVGDDNFCSLAPAINLWEVEAVRDLPVAILSTLWSEPDDPNISILIFDSLKDYWSPSSSFLGQHPRIDRFFAYR